MNEKKLVPYITMFLRKRQILLFSFFVWVVGRPIRKTKKVEAEGCYLKKLMMAS
jgi:hypothetical protein